MTTESSAHQVHKWDNAVAMFCGSVSVSRFASWHSVACHNDAMWIVIDGETVTRFLCDRCRQNEGLVT